MERCYASQAGAMDGHTADACFEIDVHLVGKKLGQLPCALRAPPPPPRRDENTDEHD